MAASGGGRAPARFTSSAAEARWPEPHRSSQAGRHGCGKDHRASALPPSRRAASSPRQGKRSSRCWRWLGQPTTTAGSSARRAVLFLLQLPHRRGTPPRRCRLPRWVCWCWPRPPTSGCGATASYDSRSWSVWFAWSHPLPTGCDLLVQMCTPSVCTNA